MTNAFDTPWKISNRFFCLCVHPYIRLLFALNGIPWGRDWRFYGIPIIQKHCQSRMSFGPGLELRSSVRSNPLGPNHPVFLTTWKEGARLEIGSHFGMTGGVLCAAEQIEIGNYVAIGANTIIVDTDFHPINPDQRAIQPQEGASTSVIIGDHVFIGMNCLILKGVRIGECSVIGAGSVVTRDVSAHTLVAGNPAVHIRYL